MVTRKILFRGKRKDNGEWVEGDSLIKLIRAEDGGVNYFMPQKGEKITSTLDEHNNIIMIDSCLLYKVDPETVGQYVGLIDKNGTKLFEGDIVKGKDGAKDRYPDFYGYIGHGNGSFVIIGEAVNHYRWLDYEVEIVGNIHDNPDLVWGDD